MQKKFFSLALPALVALTLTVLIISGQIQTTPTPRPLGLGPNAPAAGAPEVSRAQNEPEGPQGDSVQTESGPIVGTALYSDTSPALRDIPPLFTQADPNAEEVHDEIEFLLPQHPPMTDPVVQDSFPVGILAVPAPAQNFEGIPNRNGVFPPDVNGDVGPNHYVEMTNFSFQIWNKSGTSLFGPADLRTLWTGLPGPCGASNFGDPVVLYDQLADRWLLSQFTSTSPFGECIAISQTGDPTGAYHRYFFQLSTTLFYDYPHFGIWPDGYYMTANRFGAGFSGAALVVFDRARMLNGQSATFQEFRPGASFGTLLVADLDGPTPPPSGSPNYVFALGNSVLNLWKARINWTTPSSSTLTGPTALSIAPYTQLCPTARSCIPQPGTSVGLDGIGDRLLQRLAYRNFGSHEAMVVNHSVNAATTGTRAGVRWYEIRNPNTTPTIFQQGTYSPDATNRWMGSIAMDKAGNIGLVFTASSSSLFPSIRYAGRLAGDPLGQMSQGEATLIAGGGSQTGTGSRWGDYSNISVDPIDDCTFWFTHEYLATTSATGWQTRIGAFKFPACGGIVTPTPTATRTNTPTATSTPGGSVIFFDNFEGNLGWTRNPAGTDTATTGLWERGDPEATDSSGPKQLGTTVSGVNDLVTARLAGASVGANDIDGGVTSIQSPAISLTGGTNYSLSFSYYFSHLNNSSSADFFRVRVVSGTTSTTVFQELGTAADDDAVWVSQTVNLNAFAGQTVRIVIEAADAGTASLVEAAVDDVRVSR